MPMKIKTIFSWAGGISGIGYIIEKTIQVIPIVIKWVGTVNNPPRFFLTPSSWFDWILLCIFVIVFGIIFFNFVITKVRRWEKSRPHQLPPKREAKNYLFQLYDDTGGSPEVSANTQDVGRRAGILDLHVIGNVVHYLQKEDFVHVLGNTIFITKRGIRRVEEEGRGPRKEEKAEVILYP